MDDNKAVVSINIMGGIKSDFCGNIAFDIWRCIAEQKIWISAAHVPRSHNEIADKNSRMFERTSEWKLTENMLKQTVTKFGKSDIDLYESRINHYQIIYPRDQILGFRLLIDFL